MVRENVCEAREAARDLLSGSPPAFTENKGQAADPGVRFHGHGGGVWFTADGAWFDVIDEDSPVGREVVADGGTLNRPQRHDGSPHQRTEPPAKKGVILKQEFVGCNEVEPEGVEYAGWDSNFFYGKDQEGWVTGAHNFMEVWYLDLWDGIDLRYYTNEDGLKYDLIVDPGADVEDIRIRWVGAERVSIVGGTELVIETAAGVVRDGGLFAYQGGGGESAPVPCSFVSAADGVFGIQIEGSYEDDVPLVIDPQVLYSTFLGGSGMELGMDIQVDTSGNAVVAGHTFSTDFPTTPGVYNQGGMNVTGVYVTKINSAGTALLWSTYIGPGDLWGMDLNSSGDVFLTGYSFSGNYPITPGAWGGWNNTGLFVTRLSSAGTFLHYSTFVGMGTVSDVAVDQTGNAYVCGSDVGSTFPVTPGAYDTTFNGISDAVVFKLNPTGTQLVFSTFLGGGGRDTLDAIQLDKAGNVNVVGRTKSLDYPVTSGSFDTTYNGGFHDYMFTRLTSNGAGLLYSTYIGGNNTEWFDDDTGLVLDDMDRVYITGETLSSDFPVTQGAYDTTINGGGDSFILKLDPQSGGSMDLVGSTFLGGSGYEQGCNIELDSDGNIIATGWTRAPGNASPDFPITTNAWDKTSQNVEGYLVKMDSNCTTLLYSSFLGGSNADEAYSLAVDQDDSVYVSGNTYSSNFPVTSGAYDTSFSGSPDAFIVKFGFDDELFEIFDVTRFLNATADNVAYARYKSYGFTVIVNDTGNPDVLNSVDLSLDPDGENIQMQWSRNGSVFQKVQDPHDHVELALKGCSAMHNDMNQWYIHFKIIFNWEYPDEEVHDVMAVASRFFGDPDAFSAPDLYRVENDLVFTDVLHVSDVGRGELREEDVAKAGGKVEWSGLVVVYEGTDNRYPPEEDYDVSVSDGEDSWSCSPERGMPVCVKTNSPDETRNEVALYTFSITLIPPECDASDVSFPLYFDGDPPVFSNPIPAGDEWNTDGTVDVGITIKDIGLAGVDGGTVRMSVYSVEGTRLEYSEQVPWPDGDPIVVETSAAFLEGAGNFVEWEVSDLVENGPAKSEKYRVMVDTEDVKFSEVHPMRNDVFEGNTVWVSCSIYDKTSGVDGSRTEHCVSTDKGKTWGPWIAATGVEDGTQVEAREAMTFPAGQGHVVKFRAWDIAGNGPVESEPAVVNIVPPVQPPWPEETPVVALASPADGATLTDRNVELSWSLVNGSTEGVKYHVYLDTMSPPVALWAESFGGTMVDPIGLEFGMTYYWTVVPVTAGGLVGECVSGIWSFGLVWEGDYGVALDPKGDTIAELAPGGQAQMVATLTNTGSMTDRYRLDVDLGTMLGEVFQEGAREVQLHPGASTGVVMVMAVSDGDPLGDRPDTMGVMLSLAVSEHTPPGEYPLLLRATSMGAEDCGLEVFDEVEYTVRVLGGEEEPATAVQSDTKGEETQNETLVRVLLILVMITVLMVALVLYIRHKAKKMEEEPDEVVEYVDPPKQTIVLQPPMSAMPEVAMLVHGSQAVRPSGGGTVMGVYAVQAAGAQPGQAAYPGHYTEYQGAVAQQHPVAPAIAAHAGALAAAPVWPESMLPPAPGANAPVALNLAHPPSANQSSVLQPSANQLPVEQPPAAVLLPDGAFSGTIPMASPVVD